MKKSDVNGENALPVYEFLKNEIGFNGFGKGVKALAMNAIVKDKESPDIKWNFTKFVIDRNGNVVARFEPTHDMKDLKHLVVRLLG